MEWENIVYNNLSILHKLCTQLVTIVTIKWDPTTFTKWGEIKDKDLFKILLKNPKEQPNISDTKIPIENYGKWFKFVQKMGYDGKGPLVLQKQGILEPIQPKLIPKKQ